MHHSRSTGRRLGFLLLPLLLIIAAGAWYLLDPGFREGRQLAAISENQPQDAIDRNLALAGDLRINGTPGFVVGERILRGATDLKTLQGLIQEARKKP